MHPTHEADVVGMYNWPRTTETRPRQFSGLRSTLTGRELRTANQEISMSVCGQHLDMGVELSPHWV